MWRGAVTTPTRAMMLGCSSSAIKAASRRRSSRAEPIVVFKDRDGERNAHSRAPEGCFDHLAKEPLALLWAGGGGEHGNTTRRGILLVSTLDTRPREIESEREKSRAREESKRTPRKGPHYYNIPRHNIHRKEVQRTITFRRRIAWRSSSRGTRCGTATATSKT